MRSDRIQLEPTPAEEDPVVHKFLGSLPRPEPHTPLEARVLKRVWRPLPRSVRERWVTALTSWQAKMFLGLLAAGAFVWQAALVSLALQFPGETQAAFSTLTGEVVPRAWAEAVRLAGIGWAAAVDWAAGYTIWLILASIATIVSASGFIWVMRSGRVTHVWQ